MSDGAFGEALNRALYANPPLRIHPVLPAAQTMWLTQQASLVISTRYHPLVFALAGAVPAVGLWTDEYTRRKLQGTLIHAGRLGDSMSLEEGLSGGLTAKVLQLWRSRALFREKLQSRIATWRGDEEVRFEKLGSRLRTAMRDHHGLPIAVNANDPKNARTEPAFDGSNGQKIFPADEIGQLKAKLLEATTALKRLRDLLAETDRKITEFELALKTTAEKAFGKVESMREIRIACEVEADHLARIKAVQKSLIVLSLGQIRELMDKISSHFSVASGIDKFL